MRKIVFFTNRCTLFEAMAKTVQRPDVVCEVQLYSEHALAAQLKSPGKDYVIDGMLPVEVRDLIRKVILEEFPDARVVIYKIDNHRYSEEEEPFLVSGIKGVEQRIAA